MTSTDSTHGETRIVKTTAGPVVAKLTSDLLYARAIPFAQASRFQAPSKPTPWTEPRDCTQKGPFCPQLAFRFEFVLGPMTRDRPMTEDCLTVTVVAPSGCTPKSKLPVLVWYHGGANISGGADIAFMDTSELARRGVVTVSVQYRLGIFGCLEIDGLAPPNLHVLDQIAALRWVKENVAEFGGDVSQVTIMGQSAGGWAINNMLLADGTEGLFQRAVIISAPLDLIQKVTGEPAILAKRTFELLGGSAESAFAKSSDEVLEVQTKLLEEQHSRGTFGSGWGPVWGKSPMPAPADIEAKIAQVAKKVPLFIGWAADDCLPFVRMNAWGSRIDSVPFVGPWVTYAAGKAATSVVFIAPSRKLHQLWLKSGGTSTTFSFEWFPPGSPLRACHCIEMPFLFNGWAAWEAAPLIMGKGSQEIVERVGPVVKDTFIKFVKHGLPKDKHITFDDRFAAVP